MKHWILSGASAAALAMTASAGLSLTAEEAWESWQTAAATFGQTLTAEGESQAGGVLTLTGVDVVTIHETGSFRARVEEVVMTEQGDGRVQIKLSEEIPLTLTDTADPEENVETRAVMRHADLVALASGTPEATEFQIDAATLSVAIAEMLVNGEPFPMAFAATANGLSGTHSLAGGESGAFASDVTTDTLGLDMDITDPESGTGLKLTAAVADLESKSAGTTVALDSADATDASLLGGLTSSGSASYGAASFDMDLREEADSMSLKGTLAGGSAAFGVDDDKLVYDVTYDALALAVSGSSIPLPELALGLEKAGFQFEMPVRETEAAAPFALRLALEALTIDEALWTMADPGGLLPRDPATLVLDLTGTARLLMDLFDAEALTNAEIDGQAIGELESLDINDLTLSAIGAELKSEGSFAFDNSDLTTFNGVPRPTGGIDLSVKGATSLIENLTRMGVIPEDQVMVVRMMLGVLAKPGKEADELVSKIEITPEGQMRINGAPMPFAAPF